MEDLFDLALTEAAFKIRERRLSPVALMESLLARATTLEPRLKVWVTLDTEAAMEAARQSERELEQDGPRGPLHGVPVGIKDIFYTRGVKTTACSPIYADFVPEYDATTVALLKGAGAIMMGKTVTTEFACGDPSPTVNPWNEAHTPGGSSSGSAVGVAARIFPAALGSQTAGSVLRPASFNGVLGLKPSFGRVSRYGVMPVSWSLDTMGTFTRTVEDAALMLNVLAGHDPNDYSSSTKSVPDYQKAVLARDTPPRVGVFRQFFREESDDEVNKHTDEVLERLGRAGAAVEEVSVPLDFQTLLSAHRILMTVGAAATHQADFSERPDDYSSNVRGAVEAGMITPAVSYLQAERTRRRFRRAMVEVMQGFDVLLTTTTGTPPPRDLTTTGDPRFQAPWTTCGLPSISIPSGLSASGVPLGTQLVSAPFAEETLLSAAHWCEQVLKFDLRPPGF
jgi:aspartyl-tRNA(Asn)/glutamyl-tRNA(Gln) amidotransferase subunit A